MVDICILSSIICGAYGNFCKDWYTQHINTNLATGIRCIVILVMIWCIILSTGEVKGLASLSKQNIFFLVISGIATGLSWLFYFKALQTGHVSHVATIDKLSVVFTIILSVLFLGETFSFKTIIGAGLIVAGALVLIWK